MRSVSLSPGASFAAVPISSRYSASRLRLISVAHRRGWFRAASAAGRPASAGLQDGGESAARRGRLDKQKRLFLDRPADESYRFSESNTRPGSRFSGAPLVEALAVNGQENGRCETKGGAKSLKASTARKRQNETPVKSLKTNNAAKCPISRT